MVALSKQIELGGLRTDKDEDLAIEANKKWREELWSAIRIFIIGYVDTSGLKGYDACAYRLSKIWEPEGRGVGSGVLRASLSKDCERNNFRLEWAFWFADQDQDIAALLARKLKPTKTDRQEREDLETELRDEFPKQAEKVIKRARAR